MCIKLYEIFMLSYFPFEQGSNLEVGLVDFHLITLFPYFTMKRNNETYDHC